MAMEFFTDYRYWNTTIGIIGRSRSGKTHLAHLLAKTSNKRAFALCAYPDARSQYSPYCTSTRLAGYNNYNGDYIDKFIEDTMPTQQHDYRYTLRILDDLDLFIHRSNESRNLENLPIASKGHWFQGNIWQSRRFVNLPYGLGQNSDYMVFTFGVDPRDIEDLVRYAGFDPEVYKKVKPPVQSPSNPNVLLKSWYMVCNRVDTTMRPYVLTL